MNTQVEGQVAVVTGAGSGKLLSLWQRLRPEGYFGLIRWFGRFR